MKIFLVGSDNEYAIENFYVKYLREAGVEVFHFAAQTFFYSYYRKSVFNKIIYRSGFSSILKKINQQFKIEVENVKPDFIWIFKGMEIFPESLKWARSKGIRLINYNGDSPFVFSGRGSGNKNVKDAIGLYDLFLTYSSADREKMEKDFNVRSQILPFGFDISEELFDKCAVQEEINKVCFIGNPDSYRKNFLKSLAQNDVKIDVYGSSWHRYIKDSNINVLGPVKNDEFYKTLRRYRVQLNLMRPHNPTTHNMRTFEMGGIGAIQLAPATADHSFYFKEYEEIFLFDGLGECLQKIAYIMRLDKETSGNVRAQARIRSVEGGYSYKCRSNQALSFIKNLGIN
jgi:spore maturation protein CgeB